MWYLFLLVFLSMSKIYFSYSELFILTPTRYPDDSPSPTHVILLPASFLHGLTMLASCRLFCFFASIFVGQMALWSGDLWPLAFACSLCFQAWVQKLTFQCSFDFHFSRITKWRKERYDLSCGVWSDISVILAWLTSYVFIRFFIFFLLHTKIVLFASLYLSCAWFKAYQVLGWPIPLHYFIIFISSNVKEALASIIYCCNNHVLIVYNKFPVKRFNTLLNCSDLSKWALARWSLNHVNHFQ